MYVSAALKSVCWLQMMTEHIYIYIYTKSDNNAQIFKSTMNELAKKQPNEYNKKSKPAHHVSTQKETV